MQQRHFLFLANDFRLSEGDSKEKERAYEADKQEEAAGREQSSLDCDHHRAR